MATAARRLLERTFVAEQFGMPPWKAADLFVLVIDTSEGQLYELVGRGSPLATWSRREVQLEAYARLTPYERQGRSWTAALELVQYRTWDRFGGWHGLSDTEPAEPAEQEERTMLDERQGPSADEGSYRAPPVDAPFEAAQPADELVCPECGSKMKSAQGLAVHRAKAHGVKGRTSRPKKKTTRPPVRAKDLLEAPKPKKPLISLDDQDVVESVTKLAQRSAALEEAVVQLRTAALEMVTSLDELIATWEIDPGAA